MHPVWIQQASASSVDVTGFSTASVYTTGLSASSVDVTGFSTSRVVRMKQASEHPEWMKDASAHHETNVSTSSVVIMKNRL